jgi:probable phosphoglycerate mutase
MKQLLLGEGLTLYFCRHGETQANVKKEFQGRTADSPLTANGIEQARAIGAHLKRQCTDPAALAYVSSPYPRAVTTMRLIRETAGLAPDGFTTDPRLQEINLGAWDGLTDAQARALNPAAYDARMRDKWTIRVPDGGENYADVAIRAESFVTEISKDTFAVSHGAFTRILRGMFQGLTWQRMSDLDEKQGVLFRVRGHALERFD